MQEILELGAHFALLGLGFSCVWRVIRKAAAGSVTDAQLNFVLLEGFLFAFSFDLLSGSGVARSFRSGVIVAVTLYGLAFFGLDREEPEQNDDMPHGQREE